MPQLFSFARNKNVIVSQVYQAENLHELFHLPLSEEAFQQYEQLQVILLSMHVSDDKDVWSYIWGTPVFTSHKAYLHSKGIVPTHPVFSRLWNSCCQNKRKVFFWLLLKDRLSTRELLRRKHMHLPNYSCVLCNLNEDESLIHLFLECRLPSPVGLLFNWLSCIQMTVLVLWCLLRIN